jgi:hypothetical protein
MSNTPTHQGCPNGTVSTWYREQQEGRAVPAYVRETTEVAHEMGSYQRRDTARRWVRVGTVCLDCGAYAHGADKLPVTIPARPIADVVDRRDPDGLPVASSNTVDRAEIPAG